MSETIIKVDHVRKTYRNYKSNFQKLRHMLILSGAGEKNRVLKDVSFERTDCGMRIKVFTCADNTNYLNPEYIAGVALKVLCEGDSGYHTINRKQFYKADGKVFR